MAFNMTENYEKLNFKEKLLIPDIKIEQAELKFGVAIFDNPKEMSVGWACGVDGKPFRFNGVSELNSDVFWMTSLDWAEYNKNASRVSHLRRSDYLRSGLTSIAADLGLRIDGSYSMDACVALARIYNQTMKIAMNTYKWEYPSRDLCSDSLFEDIRRVIPHAIKTSKEMRPALQAAYQSYSSPQWSYDMMSWEKGSFILTMKLNRVDYAKKIMTTKIPDNVWSYIPPKNIKDLTLDKLLNPYQPTLIEALVELNNIDPNIAALIAFGSGMKRGVLRKWLSQVEVAWISKYADLQVSSALISQSSIQIPASLQLPEVFYSDPILASSISMGLVAESHWSALTIPSYNKVTKSDDVNSRAVWLRAADREFSFELALKAYDAGFNVTGYGGGAVVVNVTREQLKKCLDFANENKISHPSFVQIFQKHGVDFD